MHPVLFTLPLPWGEQPVFAYGLMLGLALIVCYRVTLALGGRAQLDEERLGTAYFVGALTGLVGARLLYVLTNLQRLAAMEQSWFDLTAGGLAAYGGLLGGSAGAAAYLALKRAPIRAHADAAAPTLFLGTALTRVGCYLHGCDFGERLSEDAPGWLARLGTYPRWGFEQLTLDGAPAFWHHVDRYGLPRDASASYPVHPTQLYELVIALALFGAALWFWRRRRFAGQVALGVAIAYGVFRLFMDSLRADPEQGWVFGFSVAQLISLVFVPACAIAYSVLRRPRPARARP